MSSVVVVGIVGKSVEVVERFRDGSGNHPLGFIKSPTDERLSTPAMNGISIKCFLFISMGLSNMAASQLFFAMCIVLAGGKRSMSTSITNWAC